MIQAKFHTIYTEPDGERVEIPALKGKDYIEPDSKLILDITTEEQTTNLIGTFARPLKWARLIMESPPISEGSTNALAYFCCDPDNPTDTNNRRAIYFYTTPVLTTKRLMIMEAYMERKIWVGKFGHANGSIATSNNSVYLGMSNVVCTGLFTPLISQYTPDYDMYPSIVGYNISAYSGMKYFPAGTRIIVIGEEV